MKGRRRARIVVTPLATDYRFWARVPPEVEAVVLLPEVPEFPMHATVVRPPFPRGVCTGCGCTTREPCLYDDNGRVLKCFWPNAFSTRCSTCGPAKKEGRNAD